ncbi:hypothetical protein CC86DRAFT_292449 [Ophiobolus disseminans]|uniref:Uncharacterized protein n=1 Tax=Ophiobolus disseminans TaxID=1469910 RepID=A0A6A6ZYP8_9PLEO|nr:hypothetical protein CC86DRAFT_292449 [Ophiobolus disseminans]
MIIYRYIGLDQYMNLALAIYPTLLRHRMVPALTAETIFRISCDASSPLFEPESPSALARMPIELWLQIAEYGEPANSVALHWALGLRFWRSFERPSAEIVDMLRVWCRRDRGRSR